MLGKGPGGTPGSSPRQSDSKPFQWHQHHPNPSDGDNLYHQGAGYLAVLLGSRHCLLGILKKPKPPLPLLPCPTSSRFFFSLCSGSKSVGLKSFQIFQDSWNLKHLPLFFSNTHLPWIYSRDGRGLWSKPGRWWGRR